MQKMVGKNVVSVFEELRSLSDSDLKDIQAEIKANLMQKQDELRNTLVQLNNNKHRK